MTPLRYASVCDGIGAAHVAWNPLGWTCAWTAEIEAFPIAVVEHHHHLPNLGDITKITQEQLNERGTINILVGGTPCQSFSVAGLRGGLADPRGNLALRFLQLAGVLRPCWVVWENVPGVLSSNGGRDFGAIVGGLAKLGYGWAYRILDAQFFGVPQRRRRVFLVGCLGDWRGAAAVLFERHSLSGNPPPSREAGQGTAHSVAPCVDASGVGFSRVGDIGGQDPVIAVARCLNAGAQGRQDFETETLIPVTGGFFDAPTHALRAEGFDASEDGTGRGTPLVPVVGSLCNNGKAAGSATQQDAESGLLVPIAYAIQERAVSEDITQGPQGKGYQAEAAYTLEARNKVQIVAYRGVRRLTPLECERLQGFPDYYTLVPYRGTPAKDGPRYKALGNSMAVPVMSWLGQRIKEVNRLMPMEYPVK